MVFGVAALAGVGFTVAIFISELAFGQRSDVETAKLAVLLASLLASVFGALILRSANRFSSTDMLEAQPVGKG
jgi:NhaA family Na+:H+ antiporter